MLNDGLVASRLDGVIPKEALTVLAISDQVEASANRRGGEPVRDKNPVVGMVKRADFTGVVGRTEGPDPNRLGQITPRAIQGERRRESSKLPTRRSRPPARQSRPCKRPHPEEGAGSSQG